MEFLLVSTWLAVNVWVGEHAGTLAAVVLTGVASRPHARRATVEA